jgi:D-glycero-D-manno-heptose 1,7-bisphosphate phosphatase
MPASRLRDIRTVFLDRDGTINVKQPEGEYVTSPAELVLLPGAARAIARLNAAGMLTILVTNQSWLSRSPEGATRYAAIHAHLTRLLAAEGARLDAAYYCPHPHDNTCDCRKPRPGMLWRAAGEHQIDLDLAVIIGDSESDLMAGRAVGASAILLRHGTGGPAASNAGASKTDTTTTNADGNASADAVADDLSSAVSLILQAVGATG